MSPARSVDSQPSPRRFNVTSTAATRGQLPSSGAAAEITYRATMQRRFVVILLLAPLVLGACAATTSTPAATSAPPTGTANTTPAASQSTVPPPTMSQSPRPGADVVDWDSGKGTKQHPAPDPSPTGWYEAAFGGSPESQGKVLYVTFDDGPGPATRQVLELLAANNAKATFFVVGQQAAAAPATIRAIHAADHAIGNHTWDHANLTTLPESQVRSELTRTNAVVGSVMGHCMRPPYGAVDATAGNTAVSLGLQPILWTAQAWDWRRPPVQTIIDDMRAGTKPGAVLLLHDGGGDRSHTVEALRTLLPYWRQAGYELKSIPVCR